MTFDQWLDEYEGEWDLELSQEEVDGLQLAWNKSAIISKKTTTAAMREPMQCGHPAACVESSNPESGAHETTNWCAVCVEIAERERLATEAERERCAGICVDRACKHRDDAMNKNAVGWIRNILADRRQEAMACADVIRRADNA